MTQFVADRMPLMDPGLDEPDPVLSDITTEDLMIEVLARTFPSSSWDDSVTKTAERVLKFYREYAEAIRQTEVPFEFTTFNAVAGQMIVVDNIEFASVCAHHLLPFVGKVHVAYICNKLQVGLSKIPRLVDWHARRPHVQEKLGYDILQDIDRRLNPKGTMVVVEARHTCMSCRGSRKHNGQMKTSIPKGVFLSNPSARDEFFALINRPQL